MRKILSLLLCVAMAAGLLGGCASDPQAAYTPTGDGLSDWVNPESPTANLNKPEVPIVMPYYPNLTLNPYSCTEYTNRALFPLIYQSLFVTDQSYTTAPLLCSRYTVSQDLKNYVFYLWPEAKFADGEQILAEDVTASLLAAMSGGYYVGRFTHVRSISTTRDGGVMVQMDTPYENLPALLDIPIVKKEEVAAPFPLGSGPYMYHTVIDNAMLYRNGNWWCDANLILDTQAIPLSPALSTNDIRDQFEFFDVSLVCADPCSDFYATYRCDYELWDCANGIFVYLGCNTSEGVFANKEVRSALTYAIDREKLTTEFYRGFAQPTTLPAPPDSPYYDIGLAAKYAFDAQRFAEAVSKAGMQGEKIIFLANSDDTLRLRAARAIAQTLSECGLQVTMLEKTTDEYYQALQLRNFHLYMGQTRLSPTLDLSEFFHEDGKISFGPMNEASIYAMCLMALENSGNYYDLFQMILNDGRLVPILFRSYAIYAERGSISELHPARDNLFYYDLGYTLNDAIEREEVIPEPLIPDQTEEPTVPETTTP